MHSTSDDNPSNGPKQQSRLDREIEEILSKTESTAPLPPPTPIRRPQRTMPSAPAIPPRLATALQVPVLQALLLGVGAVLVDDFSPFIAGMLALAAVACIIVPMARGGRPRTIAGPAETRMWRGQVIDVHSPRPRTPIDSLRDWWDSRRRP